MLSRRLLVAFAACAILSASTVFAGGGNGGSKSDPIIRIKNGSAAPIGAWINPDPAKIAVLALIATPTPGDITTSGGVVVNPGDEHDFPVKVGVYTLAAAQAGANPTNAPRVDINTAKGITYKKQYKGPVPGTLTNY